MMQKRAPGNILVQILSFKFDINYLQHDQVTKKFQI